MKYELNENDCKAIAAKVAQAITFHRSVEELNVTVHPDINDPKVERLIKNCPKNKVMSFQLEDLEACLCFVDVPVKIFALPPDEQHKLVQHIMDKITYFTASRLLEIGQKDSIPFRNL